MAIDIAVDNFNLGTWEAGTGESKDRLLTANSSQARATQTLCEDNNKHKNGIKTQSVGHSRVALCLGQCSTWRPCRAGPRENTAPAFPFAWPMHLLSLDMYLYPLKEPLS